jgi:hypothetical protein
MLAALTVCVLSCSDSLTHFLGPRSPSAQDSSVIPAPMTKEGCAAVDVTIGGGKAMAKATPIASCGPIVPSIAGPIAYDAVHGIVTIPVAIMNGGRLKAQSPMSVFANPDSVTVASSAAPRATRPTFVAPTNVGDEVTRGRITWSFDHTTTNAPAPPIRPTMSSAARTISLSVPTNVTAFRALVQARATIVFTVPLHAPSSTPSAVLREDTSSEHIAHNGGAQYSADKVFVLFAPSATIEDRQAAIDAVDGTVVGGSPPLYYVRVPISPATNGTAALHAIHVLQKQPGVSAATIDNLTPPSPNYLRPKDGSGWTAWQVNPDSMSGKNWGPEEVAAPFAWGCSIGDTLTRIGIVDDYFYNIADLNPNVLTGFHYSTSGDDHGTEVASIAAAVGNNSRGMSGMMWTTHAVLDRYTDSAAGQPIANWLRFALIRAGTSGSRVINLSAGINWRTGVHHLPTGDSADRALVSSDSLQLRLAMDSLNSLGRRPLFVLSAGNDSVDARYNGFTTLAEDASYRGRIMVVAASSRRTTPNHLYHLSDYGSLVDLAAPGDSITTLNHAGTLIADTGTSFAAPHVTGTAGLLWSFFGDSTIIADTIRAYILRGAANGGRTAGPFNVLNAYQSLKLAARRHGGRLCDNLVWAQGNRTIRVMRNDSTNDSETLVSGLLGEPYYIAPAHLGSYIFYFADSAGDTSRTYPAVESFVNGQWQTTPTYGATPSDTLYAPALQMSQGRDHDADHSVQVRQSGDSLNIYFDFSNTPSSAIVNTPCCNWPQAVLNAAGTEAWITGYGYPILNNDSVWVAYIYKVARVQNDTPALVQTINQRQIFSIRETEDGSQFYVSLFFNTGTSQNFCYQDIADTTFTHLQIVAQDTVNSSLLCALKNMGESSMRIAQRASARPYRLRTPQSKTTGALPMNAKRSEMR